VPSKTAAPREYLASAAIRRFQQAGKNEVYPATDSPENELSRARIRHGQTRFIRFRVAVHSILRSEHKKKKRKKEKKKKNRKKQHTPKKKKSKNINQNKKNLLRWPTNGIRSLRPRTARQRQLGDGLTLGFFSANTTSPTRPSPFLTAGVIWSASKRSELQVKPLLQAREFSAVMLRLPTFFAGRWGFWPSRRAGVEADDFFARLARVTQGLQLLVFQQRQGLTQCH